MNLTPEQVRAEWVKALRDPDAQQTRNVLTRTSSTEDHPPPGDCCLGVLCKIAVKNGIVQAKPIDGDGGYCVVGYGVPDEAVPESTHWSENYLPPQVQQWAGLGGMSVEVDLVAPDTAAAPVTLADLNDEGFTFDQIADLIEANRIKLAG